MNSKSSVCNIRRAGSLLRHFVVPGLRLAVGISFVSTVALADAPAEGNDSTEITSIAAASDSTGPSSVPSPNHSTFSGLQFARPLGAAGWAQATLPASGRQGTGSGRTVLSDSLRVATTLSYRPSLDCATSYPTEGIRTADGLYLSPALARLYGVRHVDIGRGRTTLKGVGLGGKVALFTGAVASSFGLVDEKTALWMAGGAAVAGALYGISVGYEQPSWREEWRWPEEGRDNRP